MNRIVKTIIACALVLVMTAISPLTDLSQGLNGGANNGGIVTSVAVAAEKTGTTTARAAETDTAGKQLYISDIKIGNAYTEDEANPDRGMLGEAAVAAQLESEGYTILRDGNAFADLNAGAGSKSSLKKGANDKIILLGYKTTTDPQEAITDLAVMNMNGGYSMQDYETILNTHMESQIKPFVDSFIAALEEYRENLKKPKNTSNFKRADQSRQLLNKLIDDDTGRPIGDLLVNKTEYEMGEAAYNKLSDAEKKDHADILTILMQGNAHAVLAIKTMLARATDTEDESWLERFSSTTLDDLVEETMAANPSLTTRKDVYAVLDKKYEDKARMLEKKWDATAEVLKQAEDLKDEAADSTEEMEQKGTQEVPTEIKTGEDLDRAMESVVEDGRDLSDSMTNIMKLRAYTLATYLDTREYGDGTMRDYYQGEGEYNKDGIRSLYPMVEALSDGQRAGLEFLSVVDLLSIAVDDGESLDVDMMKDFENASVYEGVNREIFEPGGVALTNETLRANASAIPEEDQFSVDMISKSTWVMYGCTALSIGALSVVGLIGKSAIDAANRVADSIAGQIAQNLSRIETLKSSLATMYVRFDSTLKSISQNVAFEKAYGLTFKTTKSEIENTTRELHKVVSENKELNALQGRAEQNASDTASKFNTVFTVVAVVAVIFLLVSTALTLIDISRTYDIDFLPIPKYIVDEVDIMAYNDKGERIFVNNQTAYYKVVTCNRVEGNSSIEKKHKEILVDKNDLNGDVGKQWLSLYAVKYENGCPILADSLLYRKGGGDMPDGYSTGIHEFGGKAATNLNNKKYLFAEDPPMIQVFFKNTTRTVSELMSTNTDASAGGGSGEAGAGKDGTDASLSTEKKDAGATGSIFEQSGTGFGLALGGGIGIVLGALLMALILYLSRRKKVAVAGTDEPGK